MKNNYDDEYMYAELLRILKQEDADNTQYHQIELELPLPYEKIEETPKEVEEEKRGVIIIENLA